MARTRQRNEALSPPPDWKWRFSVRQLLLLISLISAAAAAVDRPNHPPRFLIEGDKTEIVLRLKEGPDTPAGSTIYRLRGFDIDGDNLSFGKLSSDGTDVVKIVNLNHNEANVILAKELDREERDEYMVVLTLTDGRLGDGNFITQSLLILVEDVNDNEPVFKPYRSTITVAEDSGPGILTTLEATDADEGPYGQVKYTLADQDNEENLFTVTTANGKGLIKLIGQLDYEKKFLYHLKVLATDRSNGQRVNTATAGLIIKVDDVEDMPPEFVVVSPVARLSEDARIGTSVLQGMKKSLPYSSFSEKSVTQEKWLGNANKIHLVQRQLKAVDGDRGVNNPIKYSIVSGSDGVFDIEPNTGKVFTLKKIDREAIINVNSGAYILEIEAREETSKVYPTPTARTEVTVIVTDVNDEAPTFRSPRYTCRVNENAQVSTPVTFLPPAEPQVYDYDQGNNGTFEMFLEGDDGLFDVTPRQGINDASFLIRVKDSSRLDYEKMTVINFTLVAKEMVMYRPKSSTVPVTVYVLDMNDNFPEFSKPLYEVSVPENSGPGTTVAIVYARDKDSGKFGSEGIRYTGLGGSIADLLALDSISGAITIKSEKPIFDRELIAKHYLTVEARDDLGMGNRNTVQLVINVDDVNDNAPQFIQSTYEARLLENEANFESPVFIEARDADLNGTKNSEVRYTLIGYSQYKRNFTLDPVTGELKPMKPIDFEALIMPDTKNILGSYPVTLQVKAEDGGKPSLSSVTTVTVYVQDVNDFAPVFEVANFSTTIPEDVPGGTSIVKLIAHDADGSAPNNVIAYRIVDGAGDKFVMNSITGVISTALGSSLDPDLTQPRILRYQLNVIALDGGIGRQQMSATASVTVIVRDVNNKPPVLQDPGTVRIRENTPVGHIVTRLVAHDPDTTAKLRYTIDHSGTEGRNEEGRIVRNSEINLEACLELDQNDGTLRVARPIDREEVETIKLIINVEDLEAQKGKQTVSAVLNVVIEDENDNNPEFRKPFYKRSVTENSQNGITIANIVADDADKNRTITYSLQGGKTLKDLVHLDSATGELLVASRIDREQVPWINMTVKATDSGIPPRSAFVDVFIQVLDENDNNPYFLSDISNISIYENTTIGLFELDPVDPWSSKVLSTGSLKGRYGNYSLTIQAVDQGKPPKSAIANLDICITDFNDNAPVFISPPQNATIRIPENATVGSEIIQVEAIDKDIGQNAFVSYRLKQDLSGDWKTFEIDSNTGLLSLKNPLDRETQKIYQIRVEAYDHGTPTPLSSDLDLTIYVRNVNDYEPQFLVEEFAVNFTENMRPGVERRQIIDTVDRDDVDYLDEPAPPVCYYIIAGNEDNNFEIEPISHQITTIRELDREEKEIHTLLVKASEDCTKAPPKFSNATLSENAVRDDTILKLLIWVVDTNDNAPHFVKRVFTGGVSTEAEFGTEALQVKAEDPDVSVNAELSYYIDGEIRTTLSEEMDNVQVPPFVIDKSTGSVFLNFDPQKGMKGYFDFTVYVNDTGGLADSAHVFIYLLREDQRVRFVLRQHPPELRGKTDRFREVLSNVTGSIANVDLFRVHESRDGRVDKTKTDLYMHFVDPKDHSVLEVQQVLSDIDHKIEHLDSIFKEFNVLDTQAGEAITLARVAQPDGVLILWLLGATAFLTILLIVVISLCMSQRSSYQRQIKAATVTAFGSTESDVARAPGRVPNTNMHSVEGSNPIWMQAYENEWYKDDEISQSNMIKNEAPVPLTVKEQNDLNRNGNTYHRNLYQHMDKLGNPLISKKLETTEL
ncbi:unnamed protein product [Nesidiocoris tenuis]|uniref:Cadherin domain-containing protein n=1 Tax=Nesidiocoris tenuis TaxID=355587 RepID=A0A6H5HFT5_9HEMI|nr:unnamed protein product [Nesidiocoris tenuis]